MLREIVACFISQAMPNSHGGHLGNATSSFTTTVTLSDSDRLFWGMIFFFFFFFFPYLTTSTPRTRNNGEFNKFTGICGEKQH